MSPPATIPVTFTAQATARIGELGMQAEVERMLEYARHNIPDLVRIKVGLNERYDDDSPPGVAIDAYSRRPYDPDDRIDSELCRWMVKTFPPEVLEHIHMWDYRALPPCAPDDVFQVEGRHQPG
jgi:hypothetical protein